jgi:multiple sugar transport system substrate-binding protein
MSRSVWRSTGAIAVAIVLIVSACTPSAASPSAPAPASPGGSPAESGAASPSGSAITGAACQEGATAVDFWTEHTPPASDSLARIVEAFNAANPEICVRMTIVPGSETDIAKLLTAIRGGAAPDVYLADRFTVPQRAAEGVLAELPDAGAMAGDYLEFAWAETQYQGATYALPFDTDARALFYNIDLIEAAGEDASTLDIANGAPTIDEVLAIADAVTTETSAGDYDVLGFLPGGPGPAGQPGAIDQGWHYTWGFAHGGTFADVEACQVTPTDPGVVAGFQFLYDFAQERDPDKLTRWASTNVPPSPSGSQQAFVTGKLAMVITGDWRIAEMAQYKPDVNYGFTYIPVPNEGDEPATWAGGWSVAMIPDSDAPDQAWQFMQYIAGPEGQATYTRETAHLPTLTALLEDASLYDEAHAQFLDFLEVAHNRPPLPVGAIYWDALTAAQGSVELNTAEPQAALQEVADSVQPQLEAAGGC